MRLGVAFHSIRAIDPRDVRAVIEPLRLVDKSLPIHAHASEQRREVERCREAYGQTPIALLLADAPEPRLGWSIVHATHATAEEIALMTAFVTVVLAPTTEANLGDGIFAHAAHEGFTAIGSDSHVAIDVAEEVRWLEYGQRLRHERRMGARPSPLAGGGDSFVRSLGDRLYADLALCGALSLGRRAGLLTAGASADVVVLAYDAVTPPSLDVPIFRSGAWRVRDVFSRGRQVVRNGAHERRGAVMARAASALERCGLRFGW
ncbi:MAG: amidohydrolase family protein [Candidatus Eremiobacteraeota bacterium]|nr:amidohydrolase family protein [Candidatus Eremiobacteraeota bacterium]